MLHEIVLREPERNLLRQTVCSIYQNEALANALRHGFRDFLAVRNLEEFGKPNTLLKAFKHNEYPKDYLFIALLYDFITQQPPPFDLRTLSQGERQKIERNLSILRSRLSRQIATSANPFLPLAYHLDSSAVATNIPKQFENRFIGYRRSSSDGHLIRFTFTSRILGKRGPYPTLTFTNRYRRGNTRWKVKGGGILGDDDILYCIGQASDQFGNPNGYRFFKLMRYPQTNMLLGSVMSKDSLGPINARVLLIPLNDHMLTERQESLTGRQLITSFLENDPSDESHERILGEVYDNLTEKFDGDIQTFFGAISNLTGTVLKGYPLPDDAAVKWELENRVLANANGMDYCDLLAEALRERAHRGGL